MSAKQINRRVFLEQSALAAGVAAMTSQAMGQATPTPPATAPATSAAKRAASDLVPLGNTGLKVSRLGIGLGSSNGSIQAAGGQEKFNGFIKHAFDQGITM